MAQPRLENYLRTYRKRAGLSQEEVACLLGAQDGTCPARHEALVRKPDLETALAYEAIYGVPVRELFAGISARAERDTIRRARLLKRRISSDGEKPSRKVAILDALVRERDENLKLAA